MGVEFRLNVEVGQDIKMEQLLADHDVFLGVGTYKSMRASLDNEEAQGIRRSTFPNFEHLQVMELKTAHLFIDMAGKKVVVLGGGDTAMDCVRTSIRQGASSVTCAYRRDEKNMPGSRREVKNAKEEGVKFQFNLQPLGIEVDASGKVSGVKVVKTQLGIADDAGRRRPEPIEGSEHIWQ